MPIRIKVEGAPGLPGTYPFIDWRKHTQYGITSNIAGFPACKTLYFAHFQ